MQTYSGGLQMYVIHLFRFFFVASSYISLFDFIRGGVRFIYFSSFCLE